MTEHVVLRRANDALADLEHRRELALEALRAVDSRIERVATFVEMYHRFAGEVIYSESGPADAPVATEADGPSGDNARQQFEPLPLDPAAQEVGVYTDAANSSSGRTEPSADGQTPVQGAEEMTASSLAKDAPDPEQGVQISRPGPLYHEAAAATETAADYLREPAAVVSGQIIREGDAPRETGRHEGDDDHRTGEDASCPDAESRANVDDETAPVNGSESAVESASRPDAGRSASATSEKMDATGRRDGQPHSPDHITDLGKMVSVDQSEAQPVEQSGQSRVDDGGHVDDRSLPVDMAAPISPVSVPAQAGESVGAAPAGSSPPAATEHGAQGAPRVAERVCALNAEHPDWTARQIADELGIDQRRVNDIAKTRGLTLRRLTPEEIRQKRVEGARKGGQISRTPASGPAPEIPVKLKDRIIACHKAHPDWDTHQIADAIGEKANSVSAYKSMLGLPIPVRPRAPSKGPRKFVAPEPVARPVPPAPVESTPPVTASPPSSMPDAAEPEDDGAEFRRRKYGEPQKQPIEAADRDDESTDSPFPTPPAPRLPPGRKLYLTDGHGNYLDWSCTRMVRPQRGSDGQLKNVWIGTDRQAGACRRNYEVARDLHAVIVPKPTRPIL